MAHAPVTGPQGTLGQLGLQRGRCLYTHMNNTNPLLDAGSEQLAEVEKAGVEVAFDGQELEI